MSFTNEVWSDNQGLLARIMDLPFNRELAAGALSRERFQFYVIQDSLYLQDYSRVLSLAAARAPAADVMLQFAGSAQDAITVERALHGGFLKQFGVSPDDLARAQKSPACAGYTNFLLATSVVGSYEELVAAILPCFWIYWHVGCTIAETTDPDNPYRAWIDTYADESFASAVRAVIKITDDAAAAASPAIRTRMAEAFHRASVYEWMFWDSAYRMETWPVS